MVRVFSLGKRLDGTVDRNLDGNSDNYKRRVN